MMYLSKCTPAHIKSSHFRNSSALRPTYFSNSPEGTPPCTNIYSGVSRKVASDLTNSISAWNLSLKTLCAAATSMSEE